MSQPILGITGALNSGTIWHQTGYEALEANKIVSLANLVLSTLNIFPRVTHIGSKLIVVVCTACISAELTKLCIVPELIKTMLQ